MLNVKNVIKYKRMSLNIIYTYKIDLKDEFNLYFLYCNL